MIWLPTSRFGNGYQILVLQTSTNGEAKKLYHFLLVLVYYKVYAVVYYVIVT